VALWLTVSQTTVRGFMALWLYGFMTL